MALLPDERYTAIFPYPVPPSYYSETHLTIDFCVVKIKRYIAEFCKSESRVRKEDIVVEMLEWMVSTGAMNLFKARGHQKFINTVKHKLKEFDRQGMVQSKEYYYKIFGSTIDEQVEEI